MEKARRRRAALITIGVLGIAAALTITLIRTSDNGPDHRNNGPTAARKTPVTYTVDGTGTAQITYTHGAGTRATTITTRLPWRQNTDITTGHAPATISVVLGQHGGHATCTLTLHGKPVQHATAYGTFGRATCTTPLTAS